MKSKIYLFEEDLNYNGSDSYDEVKTKFRALVSDLMLIDVYRDENTIYVQNVADCKPFTGKCIYDLIEDALDGEKKNFIYSILWNTSPEPDLSREKVEALSNYRPGEKECVSLIVMNQSAPGVDNKKYISFDKYTIVYGHSHFVKFRRQVLGNHPESVEYFKEECNRYFDNLTFGDVCFDSIEPFLNWMPRQIVYHLSCTNDDFDTFYSCHPTKQMNDVQEAFAAKFGIAAGSLQRSAGKKISYTFKRTYYDPNSSKEISETYVCDPHWKIDFCDKGNTSKEAKNGKEVYGRIYFCYSPHSKNKKIFVGWIGNHL